MDSAATLDERLLRFARTVGHDPRRDRALARFSLLGEHAGVWFALGALGWANAAHGEVSEQRADERGWGQALMTVAGTYALNTTLKLAIRRRRPELPDLPALTGTPTQLSFPSAHASTSFAGALAYSRLGAPALPLFTLAGALALSRLYLGVHYPSDVLAGAALGLSVAGLASRGGHEARAGATAREPGPR
jgi:decaprenylphosphoryl-5-phosphoribose phosphatase